MADDPDILQRLWTELVARPSGPMAFRFILQPVMGAIFAIRDGVLINTSIDASGDASGKASGWN